jgi:hypothetical protein
MNAFDELTNRINQTKEIIELCRSNHRAIGLPDYISELEINSLQQRLADLERQHKEEAQTTTIYRQDLRKK